MDAARDQELQRIIYEAMPGHARQPVEARADDAYCEMTALARTGVAGMLGAVVLQGQFGGVEGRAQASFDLTDLYDQHNLDRIWPSAVFDAVRTRGVDRRTESYDRPSDLEAAHPGSVSTALMFSGENAHRVTLWLVGVVLLALLVGWLLVRR